jgi:hypothetical protein
VLGQRLTVYVLQPNDRPFFTLECGEPETQERPGATSMKVFHSKGRTA